jgi:ankyrin repeat protein
MLLRAGALPDVPDQYGVTALMHAAVSGRNELVRLLLKTAASRYARGPGRVTPLLLAEKQGHASTAALMRDRRATHPMTREGSASVLGLMSRVGSLSDFEVREERAAAVAFSLLADEAEASRLEEAARQAKKARKARRKDMGFSG